MELIYTVNFNNFCPNSSKSAHHIPFGFFVVSENFVFLQQKMLFL